MYTLSKLLSMQYSMVTNRHSVFFFNVQIPISEVPLHKTARSLSFPPPPFNWGGIIDKAKMYVFKMHSMIVWYTYTLCYDYISNYIFLIKTLYEYGFTFTYERCFLWFLCFLHIAYVEFVLSRFKLLARGNCYVSSCLSLFPYLNLYIAYCSQWLGAS